MSGYVAQQVAYGVYEDSSDHSSVGDEGIGPVPNLGDLVQQLRVQRVPKSKGVDLANLPIFVDVLLQSGNVAPWRVYVWHSVGEKHHNRVLVFAAFFDEVESSLQTVPQVGASSQRQSLYVLFSYFPAVVVHGSQVQLNGGIIVVSHNSKLVLGLQVVDNGLYSVFDDVQNR